jgi:Glycerophosphoryl diester phosphodiesterase family
MKRFISGLFCSLVFGLLSYGLTQEVLPLEQAHAHNDYEHERPLYDALGHGFTSVEADIWLVFGELFVAHDAHELQMGRTLESLYLEPLRERITENGGSVYPEGGTLTLLIDIKTDGEATYQALHEVLAQYDDILTTYTGDQVEEGPVTAIISGNRPRELMEAQATRYAGYDGRMDDLGAGDSASFIPLISDNWTKLFTWTGEGEMPQAERQELERIVETAHANGQRVRFWATPDEAGAARENLWNVLAEVGVDHINTDDLEGLETFLRARQTPTQ